MSSREILSLLDAWRAAERALGGVDPDGIEWSNRNEAVRRAREAFLASASQPATGDGHPSGVRVPDRRERIINLLIEGQSEADVTSDAYGRLLGQSSRADEREAGRQVTSSGRR